MTALATAIQDQLVLRLLGAAQAKPAPPAGDQAAEYAWSVPHRFTPRMGQKLAELAAKAAELVSARLSAALRGPVKLLAGSASESYAAAIRRAMPRRFTPSPSPVRAARPASSPSPPGCS